MGEKHEEWAAELLGGRKTRGSGNQWRDPMDGRQDRHTTEFAFAWDCKSTMAKSISVTREMTAKAVLQAGSERPMIPIRFYDDERLRGYEDWLLVKPEDLVELLERLEVAEEGMTRLKEAGAPIPWALGQMGIDFDGS